MEATPYLLNMLTAVVCGLLIGLERQWRQHPAGLRTNGLIALGACLFASLALLIEKDNSPTRVAAQIVTGLGFLGGGVILRDGMNVKGLTTAATIWCTGAIGTLAGVGFSGLAWLSTMLVLFINVVMHPLSNWVDRLSTKNRHQPFRYQIMVECEKEHSGNVRVLIAEYFQAHEKLLLQSIMQKNGGEGDVQIVGQFQTGDKCDDYLERLMSVLQLEKGVMGVHWEKHSG
jgi:putative Mg2+ transporter-C (MgtC) family protein